MSRWLVFLAVAIVALAAQQPALADHAPPLTPVDPEACDDGTIVADPANNTGLVADCKVLAGLKSTIEGTNDNVKRRLQWDDSTSLSEWEGISVGGAPRRVTVIELDSSFGTPMPPPRLRGEVPAELGSLTGLVTINLHWNYLSGVIPPELGDLPNLVTLILSSNHLRNPRNYDDRYNPYDEPGIPSELGKLKDTLQYLDLSGNSLGGDIPSDIWDLTELLSLRLYGNELTGTIPAEIKDLTKLQALSLHLNNLSGNIPSEITQLSELMTLALYGNGFTGTLPPGLGSLPLTDVDLRDNLLTGSFPSELENLLPGLQRLNLGGNAWTGCVPPPLLDVQTTDLDFMIENYDLYGLVLCGSSTNSNTPPSLDLAEVDADTLTLTYNEALDETSQPATEDYTVTVDSVDRGVTAVDVSGSTVTLTLAPAVVASDTVKVSYTRRTNPVQDSDGARAGEFTDELVTNSTPPAPPVYVHLSGVVNGDTLTLMYSEALDPDSEPATTTYTVTAGSTTHTVSDVEISGMTVTLMLSTPVQALQTVLLSYLPGSNPLQDLDGEDAARLTGVNITNETDVPPSPPSLVSAEVDGDTLTLTYNEPLDTGSQPVTRDYEVTVNDSTSDHAVTAADVSGSTVTLTLDPAVVASDTVLVSYTPGTNPVRDPLGARAGEFTDELVTNNTTPAPPVYVHLSGVVNGDTLTLMYSEALDPDSEPATTTYTVTAGSTTHTVSDVAISEVTVTLMLSTPVLGGQTVLLSYLPGSNPLQDLDGEDAAALRNVTIANSTGVPPSLVPGNDSAVVDGETLTLTYNKALDETSEPAYTVKVDTVSRAVNTVSVSGMTVTLTLASAVVGGEPVTVSYQPPQTSPLQDDDGTPAGTLTDLPVKNITNNSPAFSTTGLTVAENTQAVGTVVAEDPDTEDSVTFILKAAVPEDDGRMFAITSAGVLSFRAAHGADYEDPRSVDGSNVYRVTVMAMSGSGDRESMTFEQITVTITNAEDDGQLLFSSLQPQVGTALLATVDDPDGSVSVTTWTWEKSPDQVTWTTLTHQTTPNTPSSSYAPVADDVGDVIRVTADYTDAVTSADQVQRTLNAVLAEPTSNNAPTFPSSETGQRSVPEETAPNVNIGLPVIATDPEGDLLTYSLSGTDADSFAIVPLSGQLRTSTFLDREEKDTYTVIVTATDPSLATAQITVTITVTDVIEHNWDNPGNTNPNPGGGGGPFIPFIPSAPTPSDEDFEWNVTGDIDLDPANDDPTGLWGGGEVLWVGQNGDGANDGVFAYDLESHDRLEDLEFELAEKNLAPRGVWSDGETMWVSDSGQERLFAYDLESGERVEDAEFALSSRNGDARGIWSDGDAMWVLDARRDIIVRYDLASGQSLGEFDLDGDNGDPHGIWSDGVAIWVSDDGKRKIFAYHQQGQGLTRVADEDFTELRGAGNNSPRGIWSDYDLMYVVDAYDGKIYTYNMPDAFDARLASLTLSDVEIGEFASYRTEYTGIPADGATETTVEAVAVQDDATIAILPDDADGNARNGHQVALDGSEITVTVTSEDGSRTRTYRVQIEIVPVEPLVEEPPVVEPPVEEPVVIEPPIEPPIEEPVVIEPPIEEPVAPEAEGDCLIGLGGGRFDLTIYAGGSLAELRDCMREFELMAVWDDPDGEWVPLLIDGTELVNRPFVGLFPDGVPASTPFVAQRALPTPTEAPVAAEPEGECLIGLGGGRFDLTIYAGGSLAELEECMREFELMAVWDDPGGEWVPLLINGTELVNRPFVGLFPEGVPASTPFVAQRALPTPTECLIGLGRGRFDLTIYAGGSLAELRDCMREFELMAVWDDPDGEWVPLLIDGTELVNRPFVDLFPEGVPASTPFVAQRALPMPTPAPTATPAPTPTATPAPAPTATPTPAPTATPAPTPTATPAPTPTATPAPAPTATPAPTPTPDAGVAPDTQAQPVIGNTGGDGVSHRTDCAAEARVSAIGGWSDGAEVEVLGEGRGRCEGWLLVQADDVTSWVHTDYVLGFSPAAADEQTERAIGSTGGDGVSHRNECADAARLSEIGGWADGTEIEVLADGRGRCAGWLWAEADGVTSWVREEYLLGSAEAAPTPAADETPATDETSAADETPATDETPAADETPATDETPAADETPATEDAAATQIRWVIGNTGGDGVSHRNRCSDDARLSEIGGWYDGTEVEILEEGSGDCAGWLRVQAGRVSSWVREAYVVESSGMASAPEIWMVIGNTGGDGVSYRSACADGARVSKIGGWYDGTEVEVLEEGSGDCAGWLRVQADGVTSWVREQYVVEYTAGSGMGAGD